MKSRSILTSVITAAILTLPPLAFAQFSPSPNPVTTAVSGQRTLATGTGSVTNTGSITHTGAATVVISGTGTVLNNAGSIIQTGSSRAIDNTVNNSSLTISNTGTISAVSSDAVRINAANTAISLTNSGTISVSAGGQAIDWAAITTASNTLTNQFGGSITTVGEDAVRPGTNGVVINAGTITATPTGVATPSGSDGIDVRTLTGIQVTNTGTITGRHGIATDGSNAGPSAITVNNNTGGIIQALNGSGLNIDGVSVNVTANVTNQSGATIRGGVLAAATNGDGDGVDIDGVLTLNNSGNIFGYGAKGVGSDTLPNGAQAVSTGGGTIINTATGQIIGSTLLADAPNGDNTRIGEGILADNSSGGNAVAATSVTNDGLIRGKTGAGIRIIGTFADTITNNATGIIRGAGTGAAIQTGDGGDTVTNKGAIIGDNGSAIDLQAGNDTLNIQGGAASVTGSIDGGTGTNTLNLTLGVGNSFSYSGSLSNFSTVDVQSGIVTLSGVSNYTGLTKLSGGSLILDGADRLASASSLELGGGSLKVIGGIPNGQTFSTLIFSDSSIIDLDPTSLTFLDLGAVALGETLSITDYDFGTSPNYAIRFLGNLTADADFLNLVGATTVNGLAAQSDFDGAFTNITPVPEPGAAVFGIALGALALARRRRRA